MPPKRPQSPKPARFLDWTTLAPIPDAVGVAGPFVAVVDNSLLVAGGANFPEKPPWDGGKKVWSDRCFALDAPDGKWSELKTSLPRPLAYGVSLHVPEVGTVWLGGGDADRHYSNAFLVRYDREAGEIKLTPLPPMPKTVAFFCGAVLGKSVYVAGGREKPDSPKALKTLWRLDLSKPEDARQWETLEPCPGPARMLAVAGAAGGAFHLFSGVELVEDADGDVSRRYLKDAWSYTSGRGWTQLADLPRSVAAAPTPALALGSAHLAILGGDDGSNVHHGTTLKNTHPGFSRVILAYHTITDTWTAAGSLPKQVDDSPGEVLPPVTTSTVRWGDRWIVPSGEIRPGVRTPAVLAASERDFRTGFGILDFSAVGLYLAVLVGMGVYFSRREKTTDDFFLGGRRVPWWAAGLSIFGTQLSAITFMAMPAKAYATDWVYIVGNFLVIVAAPVVIYLYLPFFRRLNVTTAYEYLEKRFNTATRLLGSAAFILLQLGRMGVVVYLPAIALSAVTGIDTVACIVVMGVLATLYTVLGGIEAVIWTDVIQVIVLIGGAALCLALIIAGVDGGISEVVSLGRDAGKFRVFNWTWSMASTAVWVVLRWEDLRNYRLPDGPIRRSSNAISPRRANAGRPRRFGTNGILSIPVAILFFALGTSLWAFYKVHPGLLVPLAETDRILPWFIAHELPQGVAGLVIAALFAAAMSSPRQFHELDRLRR